MSASQKGIVVAAAALALLGGGLAIGLLVGGSEDGGPAASSGSTSISQPTAAQLAAAGLDIPVAPKSVRVDLTLPRFSNPTKVTNPLFPISGQRSAILAGRVDDKPFKVEITLLPQTRIVEWRGRQIETLTSQFVAYSDGRIREIALDLYAQADDGSVWYLGEDVFNYEDGVIADREGTWLAGKNGPPALIMPADPKVGQVYRPENIPGLAFEEVKVKTVGKTVNGPRGPVKGAMVGEELHQDGTREDKVFAPGYGEFYSAAEGDVEAMALAIPTDKLAGPSPAELETLSTGADDVFDQARTRDWKAASASVRRMTRAWKALQAGEMPPRIAADMSRVLEELVQAVAARDAARARHAAIDVAQTGLDLQLRHRPPAEIDRARFELWARQLVVDGTTGNEAGVRGDFATLEWVKDRFAHTLPAVEGVRVDTHLVELQTRVIDGDLRGAAAEAERLRDTLARLEPPS